MLVEFQNDQQFVEKLKLENNLRLENQTRNDIKFTNNTSELSIVQYLLATSKQRVQEKMFMHHIEENLDFGQN